MRGPVFCSARRVTCLRRVLAGRAAGRELYIYRERERERCARRAPAPLARAAGGKRERERDSRFARLPPWQGPPEAKERVRERDSRFARLPPWQGPPEARWSVGVWEWCILLSKQVAVLKLPHSSVRNHVFELSDVGEILLLPRNVDARDKA